MTYRLSSKRAQDVVRFIEQFLVVPEGKDVGKPVVLRDWQREFIDKVYSTPTRRAILSMGRKNGKSAITAMLLLAHLAGPTAWSASAVLPAACRVPQVRMAMVKADVDPGAHQALAIDRWSRRGAPARRPAHPDLRGLR